MGRSKTFVLVATCLNCFVASALRSEPIVDQECLPEFWGSYSIFGGDSMGQEFIPGAATLTFVELLVINEPASNNDTARVFVVIHPDSIQEPGIATSLDMPIPKPFTGEVHFDFPEPVSLDLGRTYVLEARRSAGPGNPLLWWGDQAGSCPGMSGIWQGRRFVNGGDFWYRTGYDVTPARPITWGQLKHSRFRPALGN